MPRLPSIGAHTLSIGRTRARDREPVAGIIRRAVDHSPPRPHMFTNAAIAEYRRLDQFFAWAGHVKEPGQSRALSLPDPTTAHHPPVRNRLKPCEHVINKRTWRGRRRHARQETPGCRALSGSDIEVPLVASVAISLPASMLRCVTTPSNEATNCWHVFGCDDTIAASFGYGRWSLAQTGTTPER